MSEISSGLVAVRIDTDGYPLVRLSDAEAIIAQKDAEIERLEAFFDGSHMVKQAERIKYLEDIAEREETVIKELAERIKALESARDGAILQAKCWKQESRCQASIVYECYQAVTGSTGEPGDWNGAEPVKARINELESEVLEQCRLNGMGAERELALLGQIERQSAALKLAKDAFSAIDTEAKEFRSYENARNNFSYSVNERRAYERAMINASELTKKALAAIDALKGE